MSDEKPERGEYSRDTKCARCGKPIYVSASWVYKSRYGSRYYCSWTCYRLITYPEGVRAPDLPKYTNYKCKRVHQYTADGKYIRTFGSVKAASMAIDCHVSSISAVCKGKTKSSYGFLWRYEEDGFEEGKDLT